jgi:hypothetical protein
MKHLILSTVSVTGRLGKSTFKTAPRIAAAALLTLLFVSGSASAEIVLDGVYGPLDTYSNS